MVVLENGSLKMFFAKTRSIEFAKCETCFIQAIGITYKRISHRTGASVDKLVDGSLLWICINDLST